MGEIMKRLDRCCCTDVAHGAMILAVLSLLRYLTSFIGSVSALANDFNIAFSESGKEVVPGILTSFLLESLAGLAMSGCLVYGLMNKRHVFILPYLIVNLLDFIFLAIITLLGLYFIFAGAGAGYGILALIIGAGLNFLNFYFWWVIQSEYRNIKDRANNGGYMRES